MQVFDIYKNYQELAQKVPMQEKFSEPNDVTLVIPKFLEDIEKLSEECWKLYLDHARNRNVALSQIMEKVKSIKEVSEACLEQLFVGGEEDANKNLDVPVTTPIEPKEEPEVMGEAIEALAGVMFEPTNKNVPAYFKSISTGDIVPAKGDWDAKSGVFGFTDQKEKDSFVAKFQGNKEDVLMNVMGFDYPYQDSRSRSKDAAYQYVAFIKVDLKKKKRPAPEARLV